MFNINQLFQDVLRAAGNSLRSFGRAAAANPDPRPRPVPPRPIHMTPERMIGESVEDYKTRRAAINAYGDFLLSPHLYDVPNSKGPTGGQHRAAMRAVGNRQFRKQRRAQRSQA